MTHGLLLATQQPSLGSLGAESRAVYEALKNVELWVEEHNYEAYEPFDGLSSPLRPLTLGVGLFERLLQQTVRQCPINLRPLLGVKPLPSTKGRGYMASGYLKMYALTGNTTYRDRAVSTLEWLVRHKSPKFEEYSWANHFDFTSRGGHYGKDESIIVWTALIGQAFLDALDALEDPSYLEVAESACRWIMALPRKETETGCCLGYNNLCESTVHNSSMLGAALLARTWRYTGKNEYLAVASAAMEYSCTRQLPSGGWWYGEDPRFHWIDNFHTGYNLDSLQCYIENSGDQRFAQTLRRGFAYFVETFFETSGCPRYYHNRRYPVDIQCASQAIETLAKSSEGRPEILDLALRVAKWSIRNMQSPSGYFYYRRYPLATSKTPMLHWGQATMYHALSLLLSKCAANGR